VNELINLPQTAPITCAGKQFGALHLGQKFVRAVLRTAPITDQSDFPLINRLLLLLLLLPALAFLFV